MPVLFLGRLREQISGRLARRISALFRGSVEMSQIVRAFLSKLLRDSFGGVFIYAAIAAPVVIGFR